MEGNQGDVKVKENEQWENKLDHMYVDVIVPGETEEVPQDGSFSLILFQQHVST